MSNFDHQSLMAQARARIPLPDSVAGDAPPPQGYRPDLPRPPRNAQATSNYRCAVKLLEYIESKLHQDTNDLREEPTSSTPDILENIALVKHQLDNLLGEINQLHQSAEDSRDADRSAWAISRGREQDLHQQNRRLTEEVKSITKRHDELAEWGFGNSKKLRESTARIQKLEALIRDLTSEASRQADLELQELPPHPAEIDLCGERFDDSIEAKLKDVQSANKTLLDRISQCEPSVRKFLLGE
jgi:chromosome segregation ATPase